MKYHIQHYISFWLMAFALFFHSEIWGQNIQSKLDTNIILIGQTAQLQTQIDCPKSNYRFNIFKDSIVDKVEILDLKLDTLKQTDKSYTLNLQYSITSYDSGFYNLPEQVLFNTETGDSIFSQALSLAVMTYQIDTAQKKIFDIKAPLDAPITFKEIVEEYWVYAVIVILLMLLGFIFYRWYKKRKNQAPVKEVKKVIPKEAAHIVALRELEHLREKKLWQNDRTKAYYVELSDIVRQYLERRFLFGAMELTTFEILESCKNIADIKDKNTEEIRQILSTADMAKFAKAQPLAHENDLALQNAINLVNSTKLEETTTNNDKKEVENV